MSRCVALLCSVPSVGWVPKKGDPFGAVASAWASHGGAGSTSGRRFRSTWGGQVWVGYLGRANVGYHGSTWGGQFPDW